MSVFYLCVVRQMSSGIEPEVVSPFVDTNVKISPLPIH